MALQKQITKLRAFIAGLGLLLQIACVPVQSASLPTHRPVPLTPAVMAPTAMPETEKSALARVYYAQVQQTLISGGMMRTDFAAQDTPYTDRMLAENFIKIALYDEYKRLGTQSQASEDPSQLRRWQEPVLVGLRFGASVSAQKRATDTAKVTSYLARLSKVTRHPIKLDDQNPNFFVYIVSEDERAVLGPVIQEVLPQLSGTDIGWMINLPRTTYCAVYAQSDGAGIYSRAFAVIRSEHPDLLRLSCLHEEIAQGLGLPNDSPRARPSIFNDDEEFALLTRMDEHLLRMLYDPLLRPGMTEAEARPIVQSLAAQMVGSDI
jgi:hypothetical protein